MNSAAAQFASILTLIIGVAIIAVLVSRNARTSEVIQAFATGLSSILKVVVSPVTGS
jgi:hypothetical protein